MVITTTGFTTIAKAVAKAEGMRERERDRRLAAARERDGDAILNRLLDARDAFIAQRLVARRMKQLKNCLKP